MSRFATARGLLANRGGKGIREFLEGKEVLNRWCREAEKHHYERLRHSEHAAIASSAYFLDLMDSLRRFNSHITSIGYAFRSQVPRRKPRGPAGQVRNSEHRCKKHACVKIDERCVITHGMLEFLL